MSYLIRVRDVQILVLTHVLASNHALGVRNTAACMCVNCDQNVPATSGATVDEADGAFRKGTRQLATQTAGLYQRQEARGEAYAGIARNRAKERGHPCQSKKVSDRTFFE